jgi:hypothetical protein
MGQIVPLFGRRELRPQPEVLCAACGREVRRQRWTAWRMRTSQMAEKFLTISVIAFIVLYWVAAGFVLYVSLYLEPNKPLGIIVAGFVFILMLFLLSLVIARLRGPPVTIIEHRHVQQEPAHQEHRR